MLDDIDPGKIKDATDRQNMLKALGLLETALARISDLEKENQRLKDELNQLKGGSAKPKLLPKKGNYSSEKYQNKPDPTPKTSVSKNALLVVTRIEKLSLDSQDLPKDAQFKGYEVVLVQDLTLQTEVIRFEKAKYYSPTQQRTYTAPLPPGYSGQFGPGVKALALYLYYECHLSEPKIIELLTTFHLHLSLTELASWLIRDYAELAEGEKQAIVQAGLRSTAWQHVDQTGTRIAGQNWACHIICNLYYTAYFTQSGRDRLSVLRVLMGGATLKFRYTEHAASLLAQFGLGQKWRKALAHVLDPQQWWGQVELEQYLSVHCKGLGKHSRKLILDACAIGAYHSQTEWPVIETLVCDDAPQFNHLTAQLMLCWIHENRHYALLEPKVAYHRKLWEAFMGRLWKFYDQLLAYTQNPTLTQKGWLEQLFDQLFTPTGEYTQLDERIALTLNKKAQLLLVLKEPTLPLHNNPAELGARQRVRKLDVSLAVGNQVGLTAWDSFQTLAATAVKLGVNLYEYLLDRISGKLALPSLASVLTQKALEGRSYYPTEQARLQSTQRRAEKVQTQIWKKSGGGATTCAGQAQAPPTPLAAPAPLKLSLAPA